MKMKIKLLNENAKSPEYMSDGACAMDFYSTSNVFWNPLYSDTEVMLANGRPGKIVIAYTATVPTGIVLKVPESCVLNLLPRSGWGFKKFIQLANGTGVIDNDYRGEIMIKLIAFETMQENLPKIEVGTRICQGEILKKEKVTVEIVTELDETKRGKGGFGSTGN